MNVFLRRAVGLHINNKAQPSLVAMEGMDNTILIEVLPMVVINSLVIVIEV